ncbi:hypothetical protein RZO55_15385 [Clostridium boliviensis]|uniref:Lipoprotein n=1 Tax=Clostridium boliviensis TaxID=318465 RepID=A0ABU4GRY7_9CLOT|nr:hypothetical protein [Clostridium boliviensis]MDW2798957.1 hypothetical protein [Clostridium boliviensis]
MKKYFLIMALALGIIFITVCSKDGGEAQTNAETNKDVSIIEGDKRVIFDLRTLPYDMEFKGHILELSSCELYQEKSDVGNSYTPYVIAKVKIEGMDDETLHLYNENLYVYGKIYNDKNQLGNKELSKICEVDNEGYRYYVFSQSLLYSHDYRYDFSESNFNVGFLILQGEDYRALQFIYDGFSSSNVKDLKDIGEDVWYEIKQKQHESMKPKI